MVTETQEVGKERLLDSTSDGRKAKVSSLKCKKILVISSLVLLPALESTCGALPTPFFARVMDEKGGTVFEASISLQIRMLTFILFSPVLGHYAVKIGAKRMLWLAIFVSALSQAVFGAFEFVNDHMGFFLGTMLTRMLYGFGKAALLVSVNVITFRECPDRVGLLSGVLQGAGGFGYLVGPGAGGILYDKLGMAIPVIGSAVVLLFTGLLPCCLLDAGNHIQEIVHIDFSLRAFLLKPLVVATILVTCSMSGLLGYREVAMTLYFEEQGRSESLAGVTLMLSGFAFAGMAPIIGFLIEKYGFVRRYALGIGALIASGTMFAFTRYQYLSVIFAGTLIYGSAGSVTLVSSMNVLMISANKGPLNKNSNPALYGIVSGMWQSAFGIGMFVFTSVASLIQVETVSNFTLTLYGIASLTIILAFVQLILSVIYQLRKE